MVRRRKSRKKRKDMLGYILLAVIACVIAGVAYTYITLNQKQGNYDPVTLCPIDVDVDVVAVIFDVSDELNLVQKKYLDKWFQKLTSDMHQDTRLDVYTLQPTGSGVVRRELSVCRPRDGEDANSLTQNKRKIQKKWKESFSEPVDHILRTSMNASELDTSPIMEAIQLVALDSFTTGAESQNRLVIVSDMLQHTPDYSQYRGKVDFKKFSKSYYYARVRTDLSNVVVSLLYVGRASAAQLQTQRHANFWAEYFHSMGADVPTIDKIDG